MEYATPLWYFLYAHESLGECEQASVYTIRHTSYEPNARSVRQVMDRDFSFLLWP